MQELQNSLARLSFAEKLSLMEALWDNLSSDESPLESPRWHEDVLADREARLGSGEAVVSGWEEAKERIKERVSCK